jgi:dipeptidyl aminopeptidase/acylaminoacyl peptidase
MPPFKRTSAQGTIIFSLLLIVLSSAVGIVSTAAVPALPIPRHSRSWTIRDVIEVARIMEVAIRSTTNVTAYILKQPCIADGKNHFGLFVVDRHDPNHPKKLLEAQYLGDLSWHPGTTNWTVRADFGGGVQLYDVTENGRATLIVSNPETAVVGGSESLVTDSAKEPRGTGILSYEWAPDGRQLWYSRLQLRSVVEQEEILDQGLRYDDATMTSATAYDADRAVRLAGTELHVVDRTGSDRVLATFPADAGGDFEVFRRDYGSASWADARHIQYRFRSTSSGYSKSSLWRIDVVNGETVEFTTITPEEIYQSVPTREGILTVAAVGAEHHLVNRAIDGHTVADYGPVIFPRVSGGRDLWRDERSGRMIMTSHFDDHDGLAAFPSGSRSLRLPTTGEELSACKFNLDLTFGVCSRESLENAPELISIATSTGTVAVIARPNAGYDEIDPLRTVRSQWINKYGDSSAGYTTYPRQYIAGRQYPAILVTHYRDARNWFALDWFQWEFPVQVFAERGYFVLSVNEPPFKADIPPPYSPDASKFSIAQLQFQEAYNPLATMEAAVKSLVNSGDVDASRVGIAGYSRGASIARFAISHSSVFSAAAGGDATWWDAGSFWEGGQFARNMFKNLLGGSPFDPVAYPNYLAFAASARAQNFAGPLLQQFTLADAHSAVEMDQLLKDAGVPTELYFYPSESHIFWHPRHRAAAMEQNLDWFDFWLTGRRDPDPRKSGQYVRWNSMAARWQHLIRRREHQPPS